MFDFTVEFFKYFSAWFLIAIIFLVALLTELFASYVLGLKSGDRNILSSYRYLRRTYREGIRLGRDVQAFYPVYFPAFAFAGLFPVCSALPYFTFIPLLENGSDLLQIVQFLLLSDTFALITVYSVANRESVFRVNNMIRDYICLYIPVIFLLTMLALYKINLGELDKVFILDSFMSIASSVENSVSLRIAVVMFSALVVSQIPHVSYKSAVYFVKSDEFTSYSGVPRILMNAWGLFRSFIVMTIVTELFFTFVSYRLFSSTDLPVWFIRLSNFLAFWLSVLLFRVIFVPLTWYIYDKIIYCVKERNRIRFVVIVSLLSSILLMWNHWF